MIFSIELTSEDIAVIGTALDEMPYKTVAALAQRIQAQINQQVERDAAPVVETPKRAKRKG